MSTKLATFRIDEALYAQVKARAQASGVTLTAVLTRALAEYAGIQPRGTLDGATAARLTLIERRLDALEHADA